MAEDTIPLRASLHSPTYFTHDGTYYVADAEGFVHVAPGDVQALIWQGCSDPSAPVATPEPELLALPETTEAPEELVADSTPPEPAEDAPPAIPGEMGPPVEVVADEPLTGTPDSVVSPAGDTTPDASAG